MTWYFSWCRSWVKNREKCEIYYCHNTSSGKIGRQNLNYAYCDNQEMGTLRESFFVNQLHRKHEIKYSKIGDFLVDEKQIFEVGGKNKSFKQTSVPLEGLKDIPHSYVVADDIEVGFGDKLPLWLFGFLY